MLNFRQSNKGNNWLLLILIIGVLNIFVNIIPPIFFALLILAAQFLMQEKHDWAFVFAMYSPVFGAFFAQQGLRGVGTVLMLISMIVLLPDIFRKYSLLKRSLSFTIIVLLLLLISVFLSQGGDYSEKKYLDTLYAAFLSTVAFGHIILYPEKHNGKSLSIALLLYAAFMLAYITKFMGGLSLVDVFYFGTFRSDYGQLRYDNTDLFLYNYQQIGLYACVGLSLFLYGNKQKLGKFGWILIAICGIIVLGCQSRQSMFTFVVLLLIMVSDLNKIKMGNFVAIIGVLLLIIYWLNTLEDSTVAFVTGSNETTTYSTRYLIRQTAWNDFLSHPIFGIGFGRFYYDCQYGINIHSVFYEILAETGIIGAIVFAGLSINSITKVKIIDLINDYKWLFAIIMTYLLRLMVSSDLREGIELFIIIFMLPIINILKRKQI